MFVPESGHVLDVLRDMQTEREQLAIVINEHGGGEGIVTVEDLLEELVGEIYDETDRDVVGVIREPDGAMLIPGRFPVHDLVDLGVEVPSGDFATVAGLVLAHLGRIPAPGDVATVGGWRVTVVEMDRRSVTLVRFNPSPERSCSDSVERRSSDR